MPTRQGSIKLFRLFGIDVFLHWSWLLVAIIQIQYQKGLYSSIAWGVLEYLTLFLIVLTHEFGHALACRSVGGEAHQIVLWPLGGVAYVSPPPRPGATLWSIVAGPLVNVALIPILFFIWYLSGAQGWGDSMPDFARYIYVVNYINFGLLVFNLLPVYPSDGGQILRSLLWFVIGPAKSLVAAACVGLVGVVGLIALAVWNQSLWLGIVAVFILLNCGRGLRRGLAMVRVAKAPRRAGFECPACHAAPPVGRFWVCGKCAQVFDAFDALTGCPRCGAQFNATRCLGCGALNPISSWAASTPYAGPLPPKI